MPSYFTLVSGIWAGHWTTGSKHRARGFGEELHKSQGTTPTCLSNFFSLYCSLDGIKGSAKPHRLTINWKVKDPGWHSECGKLSQQCVIQRLFFFFEDFECTCPKKSLVNITLWISWRGYNGHHSFHPFLTRANRRPSNAHASESSCLQLQMNSRASYGCTKLNVCGS